MQNNMEIKITNGPLLVDDFFSQLLLLPTDAIIYEYYPTLKVGYDILSAVLDTKLRRIMCFDKYLLSHAGNTLTFK